MQEYVPRAHARAEGDHQRYPMQPVDARQSGGFSAGKAGGWFFLLASLLLLGLSVLATWRWIDGNLLHWGIEDDKTTVVDSAGLLLRVRAFELATVKHTYVSEAHVDVGKQLRAGPLHVGLPGWAAGQSLDVKAKVTVTAGVDLSAVKPEDMDVTKVGDETRVTIRVPAPQVLSTELTPGSLDMDTGEGLITRIGDRIGMSGDDLRDRAADEVTRSARDTALKQGILEDAARETEHRLQAFLQSLPQPSGRVTYAVVVREPALQ